MRGRVTTSSAAGLGLILPLATHYYRLKGVMKSRELGMNVSFV